MTDEQSIDLEAIAAQMASGLAASRERRMSGMFAAVREMRQEITMKTTAASERRQLEKEALKQATDKGHRMSGFATSYGDRIKAFSEAFCLECSMVVMVNSRPNPKAINQSRIGGLALLYDCAGKDDEQ